MQTVTAPAVSARMDASPRTRDLRALVELAKPGITLMEVVTAAVGYWVSQPWLRMELWEVLLRLSLLSVGVLFLGASAGTFNHLLERTTDAMMQRTSFRPLPEGRKKKEKPMKGLDKQKVKKKRRNTEYKLRRKE